MTTLREAAQQALEALEDMLGWESLAPQSVQDSSKQSLQRLREALAQPEPEPVAWMYEWDGKRHLTFTDQRFIEKSHPHFNKSSPLYTHPPKRQPLTTVEMDVLINGVDSLGIGRHVMHKVARAIERAHGIGEKE